MPNGRIEIAGNRLYSAMLKDGSLAAISREIQEATTETFNQEDDRITLEDVRVISSPVIAHSPTFDVTIEVYARQRPQRKNKQPEWAERITARLIALQYSGKYAHFHPGVSFDVYPRLDEADYRFTPATQVEMCNSVDDIWKWCQSPRRPMVENMYFVLKEAIHPSELDGLLKSLTTVFSKLIAPPFRLEGNKHLIQLIITE